MTEFDTNNTAIFATAITIIITSFLFIFKEFVLEQRREKRIAKRSAIEDRLESYGRLFLILEATRQKIKRQKLDQNNPEHSHLLEVEDKEKLRSVFADMGYLFSSRIRDEWIKTIKEDQYFQLNSGKDPLIVNFTKMHEYVEAEYEVLRSDFEKLTDYKFS